MTRIALIAALVAAMAGAGLLMLYKQRFEAEAAGGPKVALIVATRDIPLGAAITPDALGVRELPSAYVEERHIHAADLQRLIGVRVSREVRANESLLWSDLAMNSGRSRTLAGMLRPGMRAIAVAASPTSTFGNLLHPGDRVDALLTTQRTGGQRVTLSLLQNLLVLASGSDMGNGRAATTTMQRTQTITVGVTPQQAQALAFAVGQGEISFVLRNPNDVAIVDGLPETTATDVLRSSKRARYQKRWSRPKKPSPPKVEPEKESNEIERLQ